MIKALDSERVDVLNAERELQTVQILLSVLPLTEIGRERFDYALSVISDAIRARRQEVGLATQRAAA